MAAGRAYACYQQAYARPVLHGRWLASTSSSLEDMGSTRDPWYAQESVQVQDGTWGGCIETTAQIVGSVRLTHLHRCVSKLESYGRRRRDHFTQEDPIADCR